MCYEFSGWFTKARAATQARKEEPKTEKVVQPSAPAAERKPAAAETRVKERETASV
jgi:hypothetical protein